MQVDNTGWLLEDAEGLPPLIKSPSVRTVTLEEPNPVGLVWHWTTGRCISTTHAQALVDGIVTFDRNKDVAASWHCLIAKDGRIFQSVPFSMGSWHVGRPGRIGGLPQQVDGKWDPIANWTGQLFGNINRATIGVELENSGGLVKAPDGKFYCWPTYKNPEDPNSGFDPNAEIPPERAVLVGSASGGTYYDDFPQAQRDAATRLIGALVGKYKWTRNASQYGHVMFDYPRKVDPGPLWLDKYLQAILDSVFGAG